MKNHLAAGLALILAACPVPASAAIIYDQGTLLDISPTDAVANIAVGIYSPNVASNDTKFVQTITAGQSGLLAGIDIQAYHSTSVQPNSDGVLHISLFDGNGANGGTLLGEQDFALSALVSSNPLDPSVYNSTFFFDTSVFNYVVTPGQLFSFAAEVDGSDGASALFPIGIAFPVPNQVPNTPFPIDYHEYAGGDLYASINGYGYYPQAYDVGFRTYVDDSVSPSGVSGVPEPSVWAMLIAGFGTVGAMERRRRRKPAAERATA